MAYMDKAKSVEWTTPRNLFDELDNEFHFNLDVASTDDNALCDNHYTIDQDGLKQSWGGIEYGAIHLMTIYESG